MSSLAWSIEDAPAAADVERVTEGVISFGRALAQSDPRPIACFARYEGDVVAGGYGRTEFDRLFVSYLWVDETRRRQGLGSVVLQRLEARATLRDCAHALIETLSDEVAGMYLRRGYVSVATIPDYVGKFTRHVLVKQLGAASVRWPRSGGQVIRSELGREPD